jgi:hypothetical protein
MGRYISSSGSPLTTYRETATAITAQANDRIVCTTGGFTVTLPASPLVNDTVQIIDATGVFGSNNVTVGRNGNEIQNIAEDLTLNINNTAVTLVFTGATYGWLIVR